MPITSRRIRSIGLALNAALRIVLVADLAVILRAPADDPRFAGKGLGPRAVLAVGALSLVVPGLWAWRGRRQPYPVWMDDLYLSILALDMSGNVLNLYNTYRHFDLIPHAHGTGAITILAAWLFGLPMTGAIAAATVGHVLLEGQEHFVDAYFGTRNVRGSWDTVGDLASGLVGSVAYAVLYLRLARREGLEPPPLLGGL